MLKLSKSLFSLPVLSLRSGGPMAIAEEPIINPHNLKIVGWRCTVGDKEQVLLIEDVREIIPEGIAVNDDADLSSPEDLVRHKEILDIRFELINKPVRTKRQKLGKVSDFSYNDGYFVQKLYVARPLHKVFSSDDTLIIDRNQIIEVTDHYILVKGTEVEEPDEELAPASAPISA